MRKLKTTNRWMLGFESTALAFIMAAAGAMSARAAWHQSGGGFDGRDSGRRG